MKWAAPKKAILIFTFFGVFLPDIVRAESLCSTITEGLINFIHPHSEVAILYRFKRNANLFFLNQESEALIAFQSFAELSAEEIINLSNSGAGNTALKYAIPEGYLRLLKFAIEDRITADQILHITNNSSINKTSESALAWVAKVIQDMGPASLEMNLSKVIRLLKSKKIKTNGTVLITGIPNIPPVVLGYVRMYKGTSHPDTPSISVSQIGKSIEEIPSGEEFFLSEIEAFYHAEGIHVYEDGVSVSLSPYVALPYGSHVKIYDIPKPIFDRLPKGQSTLAEYVFKYIVPNRFLVSVMPKETFHAYIKLTNPNDMQTFQNWLAQSDVRGEEIIKYLSGDKKLRDIYQIDNEGLEPGISIREHTMRVYHQFFEMIPYFPIHNYKVGKNINLNNVLKFWPSLHAVGKPLAKQIGNPNLQGLLALSLTDEAMKILGFSVEEIQLMDELMGNDWIGQMVQGTVSPEEVYLHLGRISKRVGIKIKDYLDLQTFVYAIDAGSYPQLKSTLKLVDNRWVPRSIHYEKLVQLVQQGESERATSELVKALVGLK